MSDAPPLKPGSYRIYVDELSDTDSNALAATNNGGDNIVTALKSLLPPERQNWRVGRGASENTYIINTYEDDPSVPVFRWAFAHAGNEQFIVLLPEPKEFFIDPTDTPNVYIIRAISPRIGVDFCVGVDNDSNLILKAFHHKSHPEPRPKWRFGPILLA